MRLTELLANNPALDTELDADNGDLFLDGVYLFRVIKPEHEPGESTIHTATSDHTDGIVRRGLITSAAQIDASGWMCDHEGDDE